MNDPTPEALSLAGDLLARADLRLSRNITADRARRALARALDRDGPDHAAFLAEALRRRSNLRFIAHDENARAARHLLTSGIAPTAAAVANKLAGQEAAAARAARIAPLVDRDGATVARFVADWRRRYGRDPTRGKVIHRMRREWRASDGEAVVTAMLAAGWLVATRTPGGQPPCGLAPGPRAEPTGRPVEALRAG